MRRFAVRPQTTREAFWTGGITNPLDVVVSVRSGGFKHYAQASTAVVVFTKMGARLGFSCFLAAFGWKAFVCSERSAAENVFRAK